MPELPEVETIKRQLESQLIGLSFKSVEVLSAKSFQGEESKILNTPIIDIDRRGKHIIVKFEKGYGLLIHLKMTGQLVIKEDKDGQEDKEEKRKEYPRIKFQLSDGRELWFNDLRKFGWIKVLTKSQVDELEDQLALGPEPLDKGFTKEYLTSRINKYPNRTIKQFLLDQTNIAGIGNIYADEALYLAMIKPTRKAGDLATGEIGNLFETIQEVLELSIQLGGSSARDYVQTDGSLGTFLSRANVYQKTGYLCSRCNEGKVVREKIAGRSAHFCPVCQH